MKLTRKERLMYLLRIVSMIFLLFLIVIVAIWSILVGYSADWTGFADFTAPSSEFIRGKTLWDWFDLLVIPLSLVIGGYLLNRSERTVERQIAENRAKLEREIATDRQQETVLQAYLDRMADLLLKDKLRSTMNREVRDVARIRTLTVLRGLDKHRKRLVLLFLKEAGLIELQPVISLEGADLTSLYLFDINLSRTNLSGADLSNAFMAKVKLIESDLSGTNMNKTILEEADLYRANLKKANLFGTNLRISNLSKADISEAIIHFSFDIGEDKNFINVPANLCGANLNNANLRGAKFLGVLLDEADLSGADLTDSNVMDLPTVHNAKSLKGAIMPDGTIHE